jgi:hypothetical protein
MRNNGWYLVPDVLDDPLHAVSDPLTAGGRARLDLPNPILEKTVLLHNGGFGNGCIAKRILLLQAFHSQENQNYADYVKKYNIFIN